MIAENIRDTWATPKGFRNAVIVAFGFPDLDVCASRHNYFSGTGDYYTVEEDGLNSSWWCDSYAWCNPPGSEVAKWIVKAKEEQENDNRSVLLVQCGLESDWYWSVCQTVETRILRPRVQFVPPPGIPKSSNSRNYCLLDFDPKYLSQPMQRISVWQWKDKP